MEIYERIIELRKNHLHMNQTEFGERLGVSRSVIKNIELNALARPDQKASLYKLICREFRVNEDWLLNGTPPMFVEPDTFSLDEYVKCRGVTDLELQIVKTYFDLDQEMRQRLIAHFRNALASAPSAPPGADTTEELEEEYKKSASGSASKTGLPVSSSTSAADRRSANE